MSARGPWYITIAAMEQYLLLRGVNPDRATGDLLAMAEDTLASGREPVRTASGLLQYRGPRPERLSLTVNPTPRAEGNLPQLVGVSGQRVPRWRDNG